MVHKYSSFSRFNYRSTHYMAQNGYYKFLNWFDDRAWYPLGRIVGGTVSSKGHDCVHRKVLHQDYHFFMGAL